MKLFAWLRALFCRPAPNLGPTYRQPPAPARQAIGQSPPFLHIPPPTSAQRLARTQARERAIEQAVANSQAEAATPLPVELYRLDTELRYLKADLAEAKKMNWVVVELHLCLEVQLKIAQMNLRMWQHSLVQEFGSEVGGKLGQHAIEVGMRLEHVVASYGTPLPGAVNLLTNEPTHLRIHYGGKATGSYFEVVDGVVAVAHLGRPTLPVHIYDGLELSD